MLKLIIISLIVCGFLPGSSAHDKPIIGILTQEMAPIFTSIYSNNYRSFIIASYVKWIQSGGARVVPIFIGKDEAYYRDIMSKVNGLLLPGGSVEKHEHGGYVEAAALLLHIASVYNQNDDFFPVFGIGLGMDAMLYFSNGKQDITTDCVLDDFAAPLIFPIYPERSALFNSSSDHIRKLMMTHPVAILNAQKCYIKEVTEQVTSATWIPFSYSLDKVGTLVLSAIEHTVLPFYGTLFHPEKVAFDWTDSTVHTLATVEVAQYFSNYFVNEARKSEHMFTRDDLMDQLIENFVPILTAKNDLKIFQVYFF